MVEVQEVGEGDKAPPEWLGEIEPTFLSYEAVPLLNFPFFNEVVQQHPLKAHRAHPCCLAWSPLAGLLEYAKHRSAESTKTHLSRVSALPLMSCTQCLNLDRLAMALDTYSDHVCLSLGNCL